MNPSPPPTPPECPQSRAGPYRGLPAVVVHGTRDVALVLSRGRGATLLSAAGAALFAGAGWWRALVAGGRAAWPGTEFDDVLDCADAPGRALEALRHGCRAVVLDPGCAAAGVVRALALREGAVVLGERPAALDLAERGAARRLGEWLGGQEGRGAALDPPLLPGGGGPPPDRPAGGMRRGGGVRGK